MPKRDIGGKDSVPRMLGLAFKFAAEGNEEKAWSHWRSAVARGYVVQPKTERQLRLAIDKAKRDRGISVTGVDESGNLADNRAEEGS